MGSSSYRGIQTMRNWPGCSAKSARKRYVVVEGVSRTISRRGTTWILGIRDPDRLWHRAETRFLQERGHLLRDLVEDPEALRDNRGPDLDGARAGHDVLQGVPAGPNAADADDRDVYLLADVVHGPHADRPDRGAAEPAEAIRQGGHLQLRRDGHRLHRVDRDDAVGTAFFGRHREGRDVLDVRGEFREDGEGNRVLDGAGEFPHGVFVLVYLRAQALRMGTRQVELDRLHPVRRHLRRDARVLVCVLAVDGPDDDRVGGESALHLVLILDDAWIRQADRIEQARVELDNRRVGIALSGLRADALCHDGPGARPVHAGHRAARLVEEPGREHRRVPKLHPGDLGPEVDHLGAPNRRDR